jgi:hypothetical protein
MTEDKKLARTTQSGPAAGICAVPSYPTFDDLR